MNAAELLRVMKRDPMPPARPDMKPNRTRTLDQGMVQHCLLKASQPCWRLQQIRRRSLSVRCSRPALRPTIGYRAYMHSPSNWLEVSSKVDEIVIN